MRARIFLVVVSVATAVAVLSVTAPGGRGLPVPVLPAISRFVPSATVADGAAATRRDAPARAVTAVASPVPRPDAHERSLTARCGADDTTPTVGPYRPAAPDTGNDTSASGEEPDPITASTDAGSDPAANAEPAVNADPAVNAEPAADGDTHPEGDGPSFGHWSIINTSGDIGEDDRATYSELEAAHRGERPDEPLVLHWVAETVGNPVADLEEVACVAAAAYADPRGWNLDGALRFERVESAEEADFVLVVAEADYVPDFADSCLSSLTGIPDASCTVGNYVIINDLRWRDGALGDPIPLEVFRIHEINHETGHWLGQGHFSCLGGVAGVNQQQFRSLDGCTANAWPLPFERAMVAARFGLWPSLGAYEPYNELGWWGAWDDTSGTDEVPVDDPGAEMAPTEPGPTEPESAEPDTPATTSAIG